MCGIAGVFGRPDRETVAAMLDALRHRGPDDGHIVGGQDFTLGARRLSIVDLEGGRQPLANEDESVWAAQNGELYNFPEEQPRLAVRGHHFRTACDTELLPHLYEEVGSDLPLRLDGMFALCVWDERQRQGLLARDRVGKKPLYYLQIGEALYFASEIKALLRVPGFQRRVNLHALHHYLALKHVPHPLSIFEGIHVLPPAHRLVWKPGQVQEVTRYWSLDFSAPEDAASISEADAVEQLRHLLGRAVSRRLMGDVPIGFFLSGGIDSSLLTALAAESASRPIPTFTLTYESPSSTPGKDADRHWANWVQRRYRTQHHEETVHFGSFPEILQRALACFDEPFAGVIATYQLAERMSRHVKVAISGDGADELFGSYLSHRLANPLANYATFQKTGNVDLIRPFENELGTLAELAGQEDWAWRAQLMVFSEAERSALYSPDLARAMRCYSTTDYWRSAFAGATARDPLNRVLEAEFGTLLPDQVLAFVDRLSMAHSLEVRAPFLDTELVEFVARLPARLKIRDGQTKYLLKAVARRYFPPELVQRPKEGFLMPITQWLTTDLEDYVRSTLSPSRLARHGLFNAARVQSLIDNLYRQPVHYRQVNKVYGLLVFQQWYEMYMNGTA